MNSPTQTPPIVNKPVRGVPVLAEFNETDPASMKSAFATVPAYPLIGLSGEEEAALREPATMRLGTSDGVLWVFVEAEDQHIINTAKHFNEPIFRCGDTLELFIDIHGANEYYEFHFSPKNVRMQLHWTHELHRLCREGKARFEDCFVDDGALIQSRTWTEGTAWRLLVRLPLTVIGIEPSEGGTICLSLSRYNYDAAGKFTLSSTSSHTVANFHERKAWLPFAIPAQARAGS